MKTYRWEKSVAGNFMSKMDPNRVGAEIETLGDDVTSENIVELAKNETSEMHDYFEWDNKKAGHLYRKAQATRLLSVLRVEYVSKETKEPITVKAYVNLKKNTEYQKIETVIADVDKYQLLLDKAYNELRTVRDKYSDLSEIREKLAFLDE